MTYKIASLWSLIFLVLCTLRPEVTEGSIVASSLPKTSTASGGINMTNNTSIINSSISSWFHWPKSNNVYDSTGIEVMHYGMDKGLEHALKQANNSLKELNNLYSPPEKFALFIDNLINDAITVMKEFSEESVIQYDINGNNNMKKVSKISKEVMKLCERQLSRRIFSRMEPIYKRQISLWKQEITNEFNKRVTEVNNLYL